VVASLWASGSNAGPRPSSPPQPAAAIATAIAATHLDRGFGFDGLTLSLLTDHTRLYQRSRRVSRPFPEFLALPMTPRWDGKLAFLGTMHRTPGGPLR
jgi:hypothetical protein